MKKSIKVRIEEELVPLLNQPIINIGRSSNLLWLSFGEKVLIVNRNGVESIKEKYALNIQCSWRMTKGNNIIIASNDYYIPKTGLTYEKFDWDVLGNNRFDERVNELRAELLKSQIVVEKIKADKYGGAKISLSSGISLEIFPDDSLADEFWRFIVFNDTSEHFVVFEK